MSVVAIHPSAEMYGSDRMFLESVAAMDSSVRVVLPGGGPLVEALDERGIQHEVLPFPVLRKVELRSPLAAVRFAVRFAAAVPRLARWLRRLDSDLVYVSTVIAPVWIYAARLARRRVVCHVHESEPGMSRAASRVLMLPVRSAHAVIANSRATHAWIASSTGRGTAARSTVVYNGVPVPQGTAADARDDACASLVLVGRLSERKGQDVAIRALALLREQRHDVRLVLVGDCYPGYEHVVTGLRELAVELGVSDRVAFEGFTAIYPHLSVADVALVPSRVEPFGLVAVEALMLGRPTVASRVGGLPEIITDGRTGLLVPPDDPPALAQAIDGLLADPERAARLGLAGRAEAQLRFSAETYGARLREVLASVTA